MPVSSTGIVDFLRALGAVGLTNGDDVRTAAHATLASHKDHLRVIDAALEDAWWDATADPATEPLHSDAPGHFQQTEKNSDPTAEDADAGAQMLDVLPIAPESDGARDSDREAAGIYSSVELLRRKDFADYSDAEMKDARRCLEAIVWRPPTLKSRRRAPDPAGSEINMRRLLRHSLKRGGEILELPRRRVSTKPRRLVLLCDVSGSMSTYTRMLLQFLHVLHSRYGGAEVFLFGTRLTRVTPLLRRQDTDGAVTDVARHVQDWSGGTRIGDALAYFNRTWAGRVGAGGAVVLIISDGWDRGDPDQLRAEMARLQRLSHRLIWLNPLLGSETYQPLTMGMVAALPSVDEFLSAHNIVSLEELATLLNRVSPSPRRHQKRRSAA
ncbi:MAG TPA: VWA domain-containing protein [Chloroflexota bacterium]|nr:VWA domain-containing protein [Chloroflexota bacterium]